MSLGNQQDATKVAIPVPDIEMAPVLERIPAPAPVQKLDDPFLVGFDDRYDAENPKQWATSRKWAVTDVISATGFNRIMVSTIMAPALPAIAAELDMSTTESVMSMSIYLLATAFGPLVIGPLSEIYGRQRILHASNIWFLVWNIACGFANTKGLLIAARFMAGFGASAVYALGAGVLGDVWSVEQRGKSLGIYLLIPLLGSAVGELYPFIVSTFGILTRSKVPSSAASSAIAPLGAGCFGAPVSFSLSCASSPYPSSGKHTRRSSSDAERANCGRRPATSGIKPQTNVYTATSHPCPT